MLGVGGTGLHAGAERCTALGQCVHGLVQLYTMRAHNLRWAHADRAVAMGYAPSTPSARAAAHLQHLGHKARADALDLVVPGPAARQHWRLCWLHRHQLHLWPPLLQVLASTWGGTQVVWCA